ncbi:hypothetical protein M1L21_45450, partial [Streptomyces sp. AS02]|nr:hypothetical protein [Streptomyces sp. AS02]
RAPGVVATVLVQTVRVGVEWSAVLWTADLSLCVAGVVGWTDLTAPDVAYEFGRASGRDRVYARVEIAGVAVALNARGGG